MVKITLLDFHSGDCKFETDTFISIFGCDLKGHLEVQETIARKITLGLQDEIPVVLKRACTKDEHKTTVGELRKLTNGWWNWH